MALMPPVLGLALAGERGWFAALFLLAIATDFLDGYLARRLNAYTELGRRLDSFADYSTLFVGLAAVTLLWPQIVLREWGWFAAVIGSFFGAMLFTTVRLGRAPCYHTWLSKATVAACVLACVPLFAGWTATPAHIVAAFQVVVALEEVVIACLVPWHVGEMPTAWHAWRMRRQRRPAAE
jgi:phosphatidylglycerophosphate synthase